MIGGRIVQLLESIITGGGVKLAAGNNKIGQVGIDPNNNAIQLSGSILAEQLTNDDAVANVLTFSENISIIEIFHEELTWQEFTVNGITLTVPGGGYRTPIGGTPAATVTIPSISCIVGRLI
jgi:hypothetical protein